MVIHIIIMKPVEDGQGLVEVDAGVHNQLENQVRWVARLRYLHRAMVELVVDR